MALLLCAVVARGQTAPAPAAATTQPTVSYKLLPKDTVAIKVFGQDDLNTTARIDKDGYIFFPLLGRAKIGDQTVQEATETMTTLLHKYLVHPEVSLEITSYAKQQFTILGQIAKPGIFDIPDEGTVNLLEAIGMAGGYTKIANAGNIIIKRMVNGQETTIKLNGKKLLSTSKKDSSAPIFQILPGDTIQIGESMF